MLLVQHQDKRHSHVTIPRQNLRITQFLLKHNISIQPERPHGVRRNAGKNPEHHARQLGFAGKTANQTAIVLAMTQKKKGYENRNPFLYLEARAGVEPTYTDLQSGA